MIHNHESQSVCKAFSLFKYYKNDIDVETSSLILIAL